jgi:hypothetical protein
MRNLKKVLSLVLATVMVMGLMMVGANAFTDDESIQNSEAVDVVSALGIIGGYPDGSYKPTQTVTRAEMAKLICVTLNGGKDPVLGVKDTPTYSDVRNSSDAWAESYIEYCSNLGIVSGVGDGRFSPSRAVTGAEAAKMLLVALGYKSDVYVLTGADWAVTTSILANDAGLFKGLDNLNASAGLSRDDAAQMVFNALNANTMEMQPSYSITDGKVTYNYSKSITLLESAFKAHKYEAVVTNTPDNSNSDNTTVTSAVQYYTNSNGVTNTSTTRISTLKNVNAGSDLLGYTVTFYALDENVNGSVVSSILGDVVIDSGKTNAVTYTGTKLAGYTSTSDLNDLRKTLTADGFTANSNTATFTDSNVLSLDLGQNAVVAGINNVTTLGAALKAGVQVKLVDTEGDGDVDYVIGLQKSVGTVNVYVPTSYTLSITNKSNNAGNDTNVFLNEDAFKDLVLVNDIAANDVVLYYTAGNGKTYVETAATVTGTLTQRYGNNALYVDGVKYTQSAIGYNYDSANATMLGGTAVKTGDSVTLYLDNEGYVVYVKTATAATQYILVTDATTATSTVAGKNAAQTLYGVLNDGTKVTASIAKINGTALAGDTQFVAQGNNTYDVKVGGSTIVTGATAILCTYEVNADGAYELTTTGKLIQTTDGSSISAIKTNVAVSGDAYRFDSKTVFVVSPNWSATNPTWTVYTGIANVPDMTVSKIAYGYNSSSRILTAFVEASTTGTTKSVYILDGTPVSQLVDGKAVYTYDAVVDGVITTVTYETNNSTINTASNTVAAGLYTASNMVDSNNKLTAALSTFASSLATEAPVTIFTNTDISNGATPANAPTGAHTILTHNGTEKVIVIDSATNTATVGTIDMVIYVSGNASACSNVILVEGVSNGTGNGLVDYIYIIK